MLAIESHIPADDAGIGGEVVAPELVAEEETWPWPGVLIGRKRAAEKRMDAKGERKVRRYGSALNSFRRSLRQK